MANQSTDLAKQPKTVKSLFSQDEVKNKFREMLGNKAQGFITSVMSVVQSNDKLRSADPNSILFAAATAAALDLPVNSNLGHSYIIPYNQKQPDGSYKSVAQFQLGYRGFLQLALRSGQFKTISSTPIYEGQIVSSNPLTGHVFDFEKPHDGKIAGYAAYFALINGFEKTLYMTVEEVKSHGAKYSKTYTQKYGLWKTDFDSMALKTVLKLLLQKYAPLSVEMQKAVVADQGVINDWETEDVTYVDNERVVEDHEAVSERKQYERISEHIETSPDLETLEMVKEHLVDQVQVDAYNVKEKELKKAK